MDEKTIQRIKKLQALAERGVGGEKTTAQKKLAKLLKDNGINSLDELQKEEYEYTIFSYNGKHEIKLLRQCMYKVMGAKSDRTAYKPSLLPLFRYLIPVYLLSYFLAFLAIPPVHGIT